MKVRTRRKRRSVEKHKTGTVRNHTRKIRNKFFTKDAHLEEVTSPVSSGGTVANEVGAIFSAMLTERRSPLSLMALKSKVSELSPSVLGLRAARLS